jgi:hypothetical protein
MSERFTTADGRTLAYTRTGGGPLHVCHCGGPGFSGATLGDLGGLGRRFELAATAPRFALKYDERIMKYWTSSDDPTIAPALAARRRRFAKGRQMTTSSPAFAMRAVWSSPTPATSSGWTSPMHSGKRWRDS